HHPSLPSPSTTSPPTQPPPLSLHDALPISTNASIGVHTAQQDSTPMILFIGQVPGEFADRECFQEVDYRQMFGPMSKWVAQIERSEEHTSELQSRFDLVCRLLLEKKKRRIS